MLRVTTRLRQAGSSINRLLVMLFQVIDFHQTDAGGVCFAANDRGVIARPPMFATMADSRSSVGGMVGGFDLRLLSVFPIVVVVSKRAARRAAPESDPATRPPLGGSALPREGPMRAHQHGRVSQASWANDESADHDVIARIDKATRADVGQLGVSRLIEIVGFDQSDAGGPHLSR